MLRMVEEFKDCFFFRVQKAALLGLLRARRGEMLAFLR